MANLRTHLAELDIVNIKTYIQSGNVFFETKIKRNLLVKLILNKIIENKLNVKATSRNWRTTNKLLEIS